MRKLRVWPLFIFVAFEVLTATSMRMVVFWVVAPCDLVEIYGRFSGACCLHNQGDDVEDSKDL
jgi:hypothetical protein